MLFFCSVTHWAVTRNSQEFKVKVTCQSVWLVEFVDRKSMDKFTTYFLTLLHVFTFLNLFILAFFVKHSERCMGIWREPDRIAAHYWRQTWQMKPWVEVSCKVLKGETYFVQLKHQIKSSPCTQHGIHHIPHCLWASQTSILFLRGTRSSAADKPVLIREPVCTCGLKAVPAGVAPPRTILPSIHNTCAKAKIQSQTALVAWHLPGLGTQVHHQSHPPPHHHVLLSFISQADFQHGSSALDRGCPFCWWTRWPASWCWGGQGILPHLSHHWDNIQQQSCRTCPVPPVCTIAKPDLAQKRCCHDWQKYSPLPPTHLKNEPHPLDSDFLDTA